MSRETQSPRAERLDSVRDLVVLGVKRQIRRRTEIISAAVSEGVLLARNGTALSYSRTYCYMDALRFLHLDDSNSYSKDADVVWSSSALELAKQGQFNYRSRRLSDSERSIFVDSFFRSLVADEFLSDFCGGVVPRSRVDFLEKGRPIHILSSTSITVQRQHRSEIASRRDVFLRSGEAPGEIYRRSRREFLYTYRYWCLDTGLIDELRVTEALRCGIPADRSYVLYPLEPGLEVSPHEFLDLIYKAVGGPFSTVRVIPAPWLMYHICPTNRMSVDYYNRLLVETARRYPDYLHLERGPGGLIAGKPTSAGLDFSDRYDNHRYYVVVDGTVRSNVAIFRR